MKAFFIAVMMLMAGSALADDMCLNASAPATKTERIVNPGGEIQMVNKVLCCCQTSGGGSCCNYVVFCGSFVPGCFCNHPAIPQSDNAAMSVWSDRPRRL